MTRCFACNRELEEGGRRGRFLKMYCDKHVKFSQAFGNTINNFRKSFFNVYAQANMIGLTNRKRGLTVD